MPFVPTDTPAPAFGLGTFFGAIAYLWLLIPEMPEVLSEVTALVAKGYAQNSRVNVLETEEIY
jgi:hypothetical protein